MSIYLIKTKSGTTKELSVEDIQKYVDAGKMPVHVKLRNKETGEGERIEDILAAAATPVEEESEEVEEDETFESDDDSGFGDADDIGSDDSDGDWGDDGDDETDASDEHDDWGEDSDSGDSDDADNDEENDDDWDEDEDIEEDTGFTVEEPSVDAAPPTQKARHSRDGTPASVDKPKGGKGGMLVGLLLGLVLGFGSGVVYFAVLQDPVGLSAMMGGDATDADTTDTDTDAEDGA